MGLSLGKLAVILTADDSKFNRVMAGAEKRITSVSKLAAFTGLMGVGQGLAAAVAPAVGALVAIPAAAAGAAVALTALKMAVKGFGAAIGPALAGDMEAFEEGLEALPKNARLAARELGGAFFGLQKKVQNAFFKPVAKASEGLGKALQGPLRKGMTGVGGALGGVAAEVAKFAKSAETIGFLKELFKSVKDGVSGAKDGVGTLLIGIKDLVAVFVPSFAGIGDSAGNAMSRLGVWLSAISRGGDATRWMTNAKTTLGEMWGVAKNLGSAISGIFSASGAGAGDFLATLTQLTAQFSAWVNSAQGQEKIGNGFALLSQVASDLAVILPGVVAVIGQLAAWIGGLPPGVQGVVSGFLAWSIVGGLVIGKLQGIFSAIGSVAGGIGKMSSYLQNPDTRFRSFFSKVGSGMRSMGQSIAGGARAAGSWLAGMGRSAAGMAANAGRAMGSMAGSIARGAAGFGRAAGQMAMAAGQTAIQFVASVGRMIAAGTMLAIRHMANAIVMAAAWVLANWPIALIIVAVIALVAFFILCWDEIKAVTVAVFTAIWEFIKGAFDFVMGVIDFCINWVKENWPLLLAIITGPFGLALFFILKFKDDIIAGIKFAIQWVIDKFGDLISFVTGLPGKIASAASGMFNGIKDAFRSALNTLIGMWNNLSLSIPEFEVLGVKIGGFTLSTPDIPMLANGGTALTRGTVLVGEKGPELLDMPKAARVRPLDSNADGKEGRTMRKQGPRVVIEKMEVRGYSDRFDFDDTVRRAEARAAMVAP